MNPSEVQIREVQSVLSAFPAEVVNAALKMRGRSKRGGRITIDESSWKVWDGGGHPPRPYEWREMAGRIYYRSSPPAGEKTTVTAPRGSSKPTSSKAGTKLCPDCGSQAFASTVCPKCAKGKAGIRKQWICGENSDHVFYTE